MNLHAKMLGYAGLLPFIGMPLLISMEYITVFQGTLYFCQYSAIILSFFGGLHWFDALQNNRHSHQIYVAMLPSIVAWLCLALLSPGLTITLLAISYVLMLIYDLRYLDMPAGYNKLRIKLSTLVLICHGISYFLYV